MDKLKERATSFKRLLEYEYKIILGRKGHKTEIIIDFELKNICGGSIFYLFIEKRKNSEKQYCKSFINDDYVDYTRGQTKMTMLYKEKINKKTGERIVQYRGKNFNPD